MIINVLKKEAGKEEILVASCTALNHAMEEAFTFYSQQMNKAGKTPLGMTSFKKQFYFNRATSSERLAMFDDLDGLTLIVRNTKVAKQPKVNYSVLAAAAIG